MLEQRIARVHRMGQHRPVRVFNLVTRGSIEERVLKTLEQKRSLFEGVFAGTADEVSFEALGQRAFLDTVRTFIGEEVPTPAPSASEGPKPDSHDALARAGVQFLEALANLCAAAAQAGQTALELPLPPADVLQASAGAIRALVEKLNGRHRPNECAEVQLGSYRKRYAERVESEAAMTMAQLEDRVIALERAVSRLQERVEQLSRSAKEPQKEKIISGTDYDMIINMPPEHVTSFTASVESIGPAPIQLTLSDAELDSLHPVFVDQSQNADAFEKEGDLGP